jgi:hypothetical protein
MIDQVVRAVLIGIAAAFVLVFAFNSKKPYPQWMLAHYRHPWLWIVLAGVAVFLYVYDTLLLVLFVLMIVSIHLDILVLGKANNNESDAEDIQNDDRIMFGVPLSKTGDVANYPL